MALKSKRLRKLLTACLLTSAAAVCLTIFVHGCSIQSSGQESTEIPIIAYNTSGNEISTAQTEKDIQYLINKGYSPVFASEAAKCINGTKELPAKAIVLCFDGGYSRYCTELLPILKKYRIKAVISVSGRQTELASNSADDNTAYLRWEQIQQLHDTGLIEFSNETFSYHGGPDFCRKETESYEDYRCRIIADIDRLQRLFADYCGFEPKVFTYPEGRSSMSSSQLVSDLGFTAGLCLGRRNAVTAGENKSDPMRLPRLIRSENTELSKLLSEDQ